MLVTGKEELGSEIAGADGKNEKHLWGVGDQ
jgi:hypothetical protein